MSHIKCKLSESYQNKGQFFYNYAIKGNKSFVLYTDTLGYYAPV